MEPWKHLPSGPHKFTYVDNQRYQSGWWKKWGPLQCSKTLGWPLHLRIKIRWLRSTNTVVRNKGVYPCGSAILVTFSCLLVKCSNHLCDLWLSGIYTLPRTTVLWKKQALNFLNVNSNFCWIRMTLQTPRSIMRFEGSSIPPRRWKMFSAGAETWAHAFMKRFWSLQLVWRRVPNWVPWSQFFRKPSSLHRPKRGKKYISTLRSGVAM